MFTHCSIRFADGRPEVEHDSKDDRPINFTYTTGEGPSARLLLLEAAQPDGRRAIASAYGLANVHVSSITEQEIRFTAFAAVNPEPYNSVPATAHAAAVRVNVTLTLGG